MFDDEAVEVLLIVSLSLDDALDVEDDDIVSEAELVGVEKIVLVPVRTAEPVVDGVRVLDNEFVPELDIVSVDDMSELDGEPVFVPVTTGVRVCDCVCD